MNIAPQIRLAEYFASVYGNSRNALDAYPEHVGHLHAVSDTFTDVRNAETLRAKGPVMLFTMAHSWMISAAHLAATGQMPPAYMAARGCVQAALYGFYLDRHRELRSVWYNRPDSPAARKAAREAFKAGVMKAELASENEAVANQFGVIYHAAIDLGAHPNPGKRVKLPRFIRPACFRTGCGAGWRRVRGRRSHVAPRAPAVPSLR